MKRFKAKFLKEQGFCYRKDCKKYELTRGFKHFLVERGDNTLYVKSDIQLHLMPNLIIAANCNYYNVRGGDMHGGLGSFYWIEGVETDDLIDLIYTITKSFVKIVE